MKQVDIITDDLNQVFRLTISSSKYIDVSMTYKEQQRAWFLSFSYGNFQVNNLRVVTSGNILHQYRNLIPFGLSCVTEGNQEPLLQKDFTSGRSKLYYLNASDVSAHTEVISGQATA